MFKGNKNPNSITSDMLVVNSFNKAFPVRKDTYEHRLNNTRPIMEGLNISDVSDTKNVLTTIVLPDYNKAYNTKFVCDLKDKDIYEFIYRSRKFRRNEGSKIIYTDYTPTQLEERFRTRYPSEIQTMLNNASTLKNDIAYELNGNITPENIDRYFNNSLNKNPLNQTNYNNTITKVINPVVATDIENLNTIPTDITTTQIDVTKEKTKTTINASNIEMELKQSFSNNSTKKKTLENSIDELKAYINNKNTTKQSLETTKQSLETTKPTLESSIAELKDLIKEVSKNFKSNPTNDGMNR